MIKAHDLEQIRRDAERIETRRKRRMGASVERIDGILSTVIVPGGTTISPGALTGYARTYTQLIGDGVATTINVSHGLASSALVVQCYLVATPFTLQAPTSIAIPDANTVTIVFGVAPATNAVRVTIAGGG